MFEAWVQHLEGGRPAGGKLSQADELRCRVRGFRDAAGIGGKAVVNETFAGLPRPPSCGARGGCVGWRVSPLPIGCASRA
jgi:hypothetical protein